MLYLSKPPLIAVRLNFRGLYKNIELHNLSRSKADLICVHSTTDCGHLMNSTLDSFNKTQHLPAEIIRIEAVKFLVFGNTDETTSLKCTASANERQESTGP